MRSPDVDGRILKAPGSFQTVVTQHNERRTTAAGVIFDRPTHCTERPLLGSHSQVGRNTTIVPETEYHAIGADRIIGGAVVAAAAAGRRRQRTAAFRFESRFTVVCITQAELTFSVVEPDVVAARYRTAS